MQTHCLEVSGDFACFTRLDNAAVSQLLDRGERLEAVIAGLAESSNPWERVQVEVRWMM